MWSREPRLVVALAAAVASACGQDAGPPRGSGVDSSADVPEPDYVEMRLVGQPGRPRVLVYTFENVWHHPSMIELRGAIINMHDTRGFTVITTNHPLAITAKTLAEADVIVFAVTSGVGLTSSGKADLEAWIRAGGGFVGFHSATFTEPFWPFYVSNLGTSLAGTSGGQWRATVGLSRTHPITAGLPDPQLDDEWYSFSQRPETIPGAQMVITLDEDTLSPDFPAVNKQGYHPIGWANDRFGGRMFYSAFGHNPATFDDPTVLEITGRSIEWAAHQR
jgi:type 1 glutamine amidotransferase